MNPETRILLHSPAIFPPVALSVYAAYPTLLANTPLEGYICLEIGAVRFIVVDPQNTQLFRADEEYQWIFAGDDLYSVMGKVAAGICTSNRIPITPSVEPHADGGFVAGMQVAGYELFAISGVIIAPNPAAHQQRIEPLIFADRVEGEAVVTGAIGALTPCSDYEATRPA